MFTLEAHCRSGNYLAAVVPMMNKHLCTEYHVLVFHYGQEIYDETERSLEAAMETAKAYLDWRAEQDMES